MGDGGWMTSPLTRWTREVLRQEATHDSQEAGRIAVKEQRAKKKAQRDARRKNRR